MGYNVGDVVLIRVKGVIRKGVVVTRAGSALPYLVRIDRDIEFWVGDDNPDWLIIDLVSTIRQALY